MTSKLETFDPNESTTEGKSIRFPSPKFPAASAEHYALALADASKSFDLGAEIGKSLTTYREYLSKGVAAPPSAYSYANMSVMPDQSVSSGIIPWPGLDPSSLYKIVLEHIAPQMIIGMRIDDVLRYSRYTSYPWRAGWRFELAEGVKNPTSQDFVDMNEAREFLENCSIFKNDNVRDRDESEINDFQHFLTKIIRDTLTYDGIAVATDMTIGGKIKSFKAIPAGNIRLVNKYIGFRGDKNVFAVLIDQVGIVSQNPVPGLASNEPVTFTRDDLIWYVRNARTDLGVADYGLPEIESAIRLIQAFSNIIEMLADQFTKCLSEDTEVLTQNGWKLFGDIDIETDTFATLNLETGFMEYQKATDSIWKDYDGEMYNLKSRSFNFLVTPQHRIITQVRNNYKSPTGAYRHPYRITEAQDLYEKFDEKRNLCYCLPTTSEWRGEEIKHKSFVKNPVQYEEIGTMSGDDYCAFMGMYLSEGNLGREYGKGHSADRNVIWIHQRPYSKGFEPYRLLLNRIIDRDPCHTGNTFKFSWKGLAKHLGEFGGNCYEKRIPEEILNATPRQQKIFWDYYSLGDGSVGYYQTKNSKRKHRTEHISTTSKIMSDQLQELAQKMGYAATIHPVDPTKYHGFIAGREIKSCRTRYDIRLKSSKMQSTQLIKTRYSGKIGCVTVPNGTLYVRREGKACWTGNSSIPNGILLLKGPSWTQKQIDMIQRVMENLLKGITKRWSLPILATPDDQGIEMLELNNLNGADGRFNAFLNQSIGGICTIFRFPASRFGYFTSGQHHDNVLQHSDNSRVGQMDSDTDDPGLAPLLIHIENLINQYLLAGNWPRLRFTFTAKTPKENAREFQSRLDAMTLGEARELVDLPTYASAYEKAMKTFGITPSDEDQEEMKKMLALISMSPLNPNLTSPFQTILANAIKSGEKDAELSGGTGIGQRDPAASEAAGNATAGVRRNSAEEKRKPR